jgi:hypothetical protein
MQRRGNLRAQKSIRGDMRSRAQEVNMEAFFSYKQASSCFKGTLLIFCSYSAHTLPILYPCSAHTILTLFLYSSQTVLTLYQCSSYTLLTLCVKGGGSRVGRKRETGVLVYKKSIEQVKNMVCKNIVVLFVFMFYFIFFE